MVATEAAAPARPPVMTGGEIAACMAAHGVGGEMIALVVQAFESFDARLAAAVEAATAPERARKAAQAARKARSRQRLRQAQPEEAASPRHASGAPGRADPSSQAVLPFLSVSPDVGGLPDPMPREAQPPQADQAAGLAPVAPQQAQSPDERGRVDACDGGDAPSGDAPAAVPPPSRLRPATTSALQGPPSSPEPLTSPPISPRTTRDRAPPLDELQAKLCAAGGAALAATAEAPGLIAMSEPLNWLRQGCDVEADILRTVSARSSRAAPGSIRSWRYFSDAVIEARAARLRSRPDHPHSVQPTAETRHDERQDRSRDRPEDRPGEPVALLHRAASRPPTSGERFLAGMARALERRGEGGGGGAAGGAGGADPDGGAGGVDRAAHR